MTLFYIHIIIHIFYSFSNFFSYYYTFSMFIQYIFLISFSFHNNQAVYQEQISFGNNYKGMNNIVGFNASFFNNHPDWSHYNKQVNKDVVDRHSSANRQINPGMLV